MTLEDPVRLLRGGGPEVRALLRSTGTDGPSPAQLDLLAAKLPTIGVGVAPAAAGLGLKAWLAIALVSGATVVGAVAWRRSSAPAARVAPAVLVAPPGAQAPVAVASVPTLPPAPIVAIATPAPLGESDPAALRPHRAKPLAPPPIVATASPAASVTAAPPAPAPAHAMTAPPELELLGSAQDALRQGAWQRALDLTADHDRQYPAGAMSEEREAIAVEALARLGRADDARARLQAFVLRFPRSAYRGRLERLAATATAP